MQLKTMNDDNTLNQLRETIKLPEDNQGTQLTSTTNVCRSLNNNVSQDAMITQKHEIDALFNN